MKNVLRNCWYLGAWSYEVADQPLARRILDTPMVFFRNENGEIAALRDRCPHRFAPLSRGRMVEGALQCAYHGLSFDKGGNCAGAPFAADDISGISVASFPVLEADGYIWIWPGEPSKADQSLVPDMSYLKPAPTIDLIRMYMEQKSNFFLGIDNLMDPSHIIFLHRASIGQGTDFLTELFSTATYTCGNYADGYITSRWSFLDADGRPHEDERFEAIWYPPSMIVQRSRSRLTGDKPTTTPYHYFVHFMTPETDSTTHYFAMEAYDVGRVHPSYPTERARLLKELTFLAEDDPMLADIDDEMAGADLLSLKPVILHADAGAIQVHRAYARLLEAERRNSD